MNSGLRDRILAVFGDVYRNQTESEAVPELTDQTVLLQTGLDSLGFAVLVVTLEQELGYDPFVLSDEAYYPATFGEFVRFYEANTPR
jgi:acyl carrier protein